MKRYFITGTDTDSGKTYVTCELMQYLKTKYKNIIALKPVASGCIQHNGVWINEDIQKLQSCNRDVLQEISPWRFEAPISPHLAAANMGQRVSAKAISDFCLQPSFNAFDGQLIEGAGGLMAPLNERETWVDFLLQSSIPVVLVVGMRLGCLNHALLTTTVLKSHGIAYVGWIANVVDKSMQALSENIATLTQKIDAPLLGYAGYGEKLTILQDIF